MREIGLKGGDYILRGLVTPNADIAEGFGLVNVLLENGTSLIGNFGGEKNGVIEVFMADGSAKLIERDQVKSITEPMSTMPPMYGILNKRELRDLVTYLSGLGVEEEK